MSDRIELTGIEAFGHHGVFAEERREGQVFYASLFRGRRYVFLAHSC